MSEQQLTPPQMGDEAIALLEKLSNAVGVSGDEAQVRAIVLEQIRPVADEVKIDALGSVLAVRKAAQPGAPRVMVAAHMDEVGFMVIDDSKDGLGEFRVIGGIDERHLPGKSVWVGKNNTAGVIGAKPIHFTEPGETEHAIPVESLRVDLGLGTRISAGDRGTFATRFRRLGDSLLGKALDDRLGVAALIELVKNPPPGVELLAAFTVQEELGLRGAGPAAYAFHPEIAVALDCTPANDLPAWDGEENGGYNTRLGAGPALYIADARTLSDPRLVRHFAQTAGDLGIPFQFRQPGGGGTDAGSIHLRRGGIPALSISVPGRYLHTACSLVRLEDWQHTVALLWHALARYSNTLLEQER